MGGKQEKSVKLLSYGLIVMAVTHTLTHVFGGSTPPSSASSETSSASASSSSA